MWRASSVTWTRETARVSGSSRSSAMASRCIWSSSSSTNRVAANVTGPSDVAFSTLPSTRAIRSGRYLDPVSLVMSLANITECRHSSATSV